MEPLAATDPQYVGPYRLMARLGSGGMGQVYLGVSGAADQVAVKVIRPGVADEAHLRDRFAAEVDNLRRVYGARVARFEDAGFDGNQPWLAVEYVPGRSLKEHVDARGPLTADATATMGVLLAEGLGKIHQEGLLHRDLKPQNILLGPDGPKVIDFGLATLTNHDRELTDTGMMVGTVAYMPPEQAEGDDLTPAADVYGLGATLLFAVSGRTPYGQLAVAQLLGRISNPATSPDLNAVPPELVPLLGMMLAHESAARPPLSAVGDLLVEVTKASGRSIAELREELVRVTTADRDDDLPVELPEPDIDDLDLGTEAEESEPVVTPREQPPEIDVGWLVEQVRDEYDRKRVL